MAYTKLYEKDGKRYWRVEISRGRGKANYSTRFYWEDGWSKRTAERQLNKFIRDFERDIEDGKVLSRSELREQKKQAEIEKAKIKTVSQYANGVFMAIKETTFSENARSNYRMFLDKHILPKIGKMLMTDITPAILTKLIVNFQKSGYAHATCVKLYNILNGIFEMAFLDDSIPMNPMAKVKRPAPRKDETVKQEADKSYTIEELQYILSCVEKESLKWQVFINLALDTGARKGELCGLQWRDIDLKNQIIHLRRNLQYTPEMGIYETSLKNRKQRSVDIGTDTVVLLEKLRNEQAEEHLSPWVFSQDKSSIPMSPQSPTRYFKKFEKKYEVEAFYPHRLRHSFASIAITEGADIVSVASRLGHSDTAVTLRMYAHANEESIRRAGQTARDAIKHASEENKKIN